MGRRGRFWGHVQARFRGFNFFIWSAGRLPSRTEHHRAWGEVRSILGGGVMDIGGIFFQGGEPYLWNHCVSMIWMPPCT